MARTDARTVTQTDAPTMTEAPAALGSALGAYGDAPVGSAVFRVILSKSGDRVVDARYVSANERYRQATGLGDRDITGCSFLETAPNASDRWFSYGYRAVIKGEDVHDTVFSPEAGHWVSFRMVASSTEGCCSCSFFFADEEHHRREEMQADRKTDSLIIRIAGELI